MDEYPNMVRDLVRAIVPDTRVNAEILAKTAGRSDEYSEFRRGDGGLFVRCCAMCGGIDPTDRSANDFFKKIHGHRDGCEKSKHGKE